MAASEQLRLKLRRTHIGAWAAGIALGTAVNALVVALQYPLSALTRETHFFNSAGRLDITGALQSWKWFTPYAVPAFVLGLLLGGGALLFAFWLFGTPDADQPSQTQS